jgi:Mn2+/Fe2+ NRAMP family transporter
MGAASISAREPTSRSPVVGPSKPRLLEVLGPGLISGAANDDPTAIATYSQAGARFGFTFCWPMPLTYPMMAIVQQVSARIGRTTEHGLAGNIRRCYPGLLLQISVALLLVANVFAISADLGAMADVLMPPRQQVEEVATVSVALAAVRFRIISHSRAPSAAR